VKWGRRRWCNGGGDDRRMGGGEKVVDFGGLGFRCVGDERKMDKMGERAVRHTEKVRGRRKESDLKRGHVRVLNECARSHSSRTMHNVWCTCTASVCVMWASALEQTRVSSNTSLCLQSSVQWCARSQSAIFFFLQKYLHKNV
jgi:hypothetical protein